MNKLGYIKALVGLIQFYLPCSFEVAFFIACQSALETGYGSSDICRNGFNYFGMRQVKRRISTSYIPYKNHALYESNSHSLIDYMLWLQNAGFNHDDLFDLSRFMSKLRKSNYNPSEKYVETILKIYKLYYQPQNS